MLIKIHLWGRNIRYVKDIKLVFLVLPLVLLPLVIELWMHMSGMSFIEEHKKFFLGIDILYIVLARFALLDTALYLFSHSSHTTNRTIIHIVLLYLEITVITILYYAIVFYIFDVFSLFHLNSDFTPENLAMVKAHDFITAFYISTVTFTTLGSGDWIPQTIHAMLAVSSEVILGIIQGGVFVAILIYAHQNRNELLREESKHLAPEFKQINE
jgi:hypothetical protein